MTDIVERLRKWSVFGYGYEASCDMKEAATVIEEQRANVMNSARLLSEQTVEIEKLRAALRLVFDELGYAMPLDIFNQSRDALEGK